MQNQNRKDFVGNQILNTRNINNENLNHKQAHSLTQQELGVTQTREFGKDLTNMANINSQNENKQNVI